MGAKIQAFEIFQTLLSSHYALPLRKGNNVFFSLYKSGRGSIHIDILTKSFGSLINLIIIRMEPAQMNTDPNGSPTHAPTDTLSLTPVPSPQHYCPHLTMETRRLTCSPFSA